MAAALGFVAAAQQPKLPPPFHTPSASNPPRVIERPDGARLQAPAGFDVREFATGFERPRYMILGPSGEILLSDSVKLGRVFALADRNRDNRISDDEKKVILDGLDRPFGPALWKDCLYAAETTSVKRYRYDSKKLEAAQPEEIVPLKEAATGHWTRTILFDRKGGKFYLTVGSQSNVSPGEPEIRAAILRFNPDGTGRESIATGTRNPIGLAIYPGTDTLWAAVQERDGLGDDLVPDSFTAIHAIHVEMTNIAALISAAVRAKTYLGDHPPSVESLAKIQDPCTVCHRGIPESGDVPHGKKTAVHFPRMADCLVCHGEIKPPDSCKKCHVESTPNFRPAGHTAEFADKHGDTDFPRQGCAVCHGRKFTCKGCH